MSSISNNKQSTPEFDYWEFVHCAVCFLPFSPDPKDVNTHPSTVPFWLTECGHTVCNSHLKADQTCAACGAIKIQLIPLQRELSLPMSEWFRPISRTLDTVSATVRFQQDTMAALVRFYKGKCMQQRATINRARDIAIENKALRSQVEQLQQENLQLRRAAGMNNVSGAHFDSHPNGPRSFGDPTYYDPGDFRNTNGKRPMVAAQGFQQNRSSSPRTITTPIPPARLTLPPISHLPLEGQNERPIDINENRDVLNTSNTHRIGQFAYQPPPTTSRSPSVRHHQFHFRPQSAITGRQNDSINPQHDPRRQQQQRSMPPPPSPPPLPRQSPSTMNGAPTTATRGRFRPASTSVLHGANTNSEHRQANAALSSNIPSGPTMPITPSNNRFFAPTPRVLDSNANIIPHSGVRTPFISRQT